MVLQASFGAEIRIDARVTNDVGPIAGNLRDRARDVGATKQHFSGIWGHVEVASGALMQVVEVVTSI
jgi:hypothetical protein